MAKITVEKLKNMKQSGEKIAMLTAYDYPTAFFLDSAGIDIILVGDSLGNVVLGYEGTENVTNQQMLHHLKAVARAAANAFVMVDMPFESVHCSKARSVENAKQLIEEGGAEAVKIEFTDDKILENIRAIIDSGILVMGHIGLTPQTAQAQGGFKVQGKNVEDAKELIRKACLLEKHGCFSLLLECVPDRVAGLIGQKADCPVIGCGAGPFCDGQVLVSHDILGLYPRKLPKFVKQYVNLQEIIKKSVLEYIREVKEQKFPSKDYSYYIKDEDFSEIERTEH